ncbi:MAG: copper-binding protein [Acidobacteriota bacterium]
MKRSLLVVASCLFALFAIACGPDEPEAADSSSQRREIYQVRGEIRSMPGQSEVASALYLRHEAIPDFVGIEGDVVGMPTMTMPFPVAESVNLDAFQRGDRVSATLEVTWDGDPPFQLIAIEALPADTQLDFEAD